MYVGEKVESYGDIRKIPDVLGYIQSKTELPVPLLEILEKSGRMSDILINPQFFWIWQLKRYNAVCTT